ncbi:MAG: substrate-binding domain-containing protein [Alphaproteobacteria bacterium]|nr:substrate-binding domain-containing protein [Alphaproteobacteria bacterium]
MNTLQKIAGAFFVALIAALVSFSPLARAAEKDEYVFILKGRGNPYWAAMEDGIKETAKAKGIKASIYQSETDRDSEGELNQCLAAIQRKPKVLVMGAVTPAVGIQCFKQAAKAGIIVADVDAGTPVAEAEKAGVRLAFTVGSDNYLIGQEAAKYAAGIAGKPDPKIFILEGLAGSAPGQKRVGGFSEKLKEVMPGAKIVASISAEWDRLKAMNTTADMLQREPDLDIIYAANDTMALGAVEAVRNAGKSAQIKIIGVDGTVDAVKAIKEGRLTASVAQLPYLMGKRAVELALAVGEGKKVDQVEITPTPVLTKEKFSSVNDPLMQYVR